MSRNSRSTPPCSRATTRSSGISRSKWAIGKRSAKSGVRVAGGCCQEDPAAARRLGYYEGALSWRSTHPAFRRLQHAPARRSGVFVSGAPARQTTSAERELRGIAAGSIRSARHGGGFRPRRAAAIRRGRRLSPRLDAPQSRAAQRGRPWLSPAWAPHLPESWRTVRRRGYLRAGVRCRYFRTSDSNSETASSAKVVDR